MQQLAAPPPRVAPNVKFDCAVCGITTGCHHAGRKLLLDGVKVELWQLNEEEMRKYYPEKYLEVFEPGKLACPICGEAFDAETKRPFMAHARGKHPEWEKDHRQFLLDAETLESAFEQLKEGDHAGTTE